MIKEKIAQGPQKSFHKSQLMVVIVSHHWDIVLRQIETFKTLEAEVPSWYIQSCPSALGERILTLIRRIPRKIL